MEQQSADGANRTGFERRPRMIDRSEEERRISTTEWPHPEQRRGRDRRERGDRRCGADRRNAEWMF